MSSNDFEFEPTPDFMGEDQAKEFRLVQLAGRAIGLKIQYSDNVGGYTTGTPYAADDKGWDPTFRDIDAFQLLTQLQMYIDYSHRGHPGSGCVKVMCGPLIEVTVEKDGDVTLATRRAITEAAATMGARR